ncbi:MAG: SDR family oxidoreductase [Alphaproteobacteria bacterium]|jgi:3-oxoacyl-[acyl-carrier protein] reductase|nr:SDR family oxidoreductase [Alphaproteobacteria bacterium]
MLALVTGANSGIGHAIATRLARAGWNLLLTGLEPAVEAMPAAMQAAGAPQARAVAGDLTDKAFIARLADLVSAGGQPLTLLVNCAGASRACSFLEQDDADWQRLIDINLTSAFRLTQAVAPGMIAHGQGGAIVNIASIAYVSGGANPAYGAAKAGLVALTYNLAQELGPHGIRVNAVAPGVIATEMVRNAFPGERFTRLHNAVAGRTPLRRLGSPEDVAGVVEFLSGQASAFVTGAVIPVTGGLELLPTLGRFLGPEA